MEDGRMWPLLPLKHGRLLTLEQGDKEAEGGEGVKG
jgi:hypothetical protein